MVSLSLNSALVVGAVTALVSAGGNTAFAQSKGAMEARQFSGVTVRAIKAAKVKYLGEGRVEMLSDWMDIPDFSSRVGPPVNAWDSYEWCDGAGQNASSAAAGAVPVGYDPVTFLNTLACMGIGSRYFFGLDYTNEFYATDFVSAPGTGGATVQELNCGGFYNPPVPTALFRFYFPYDDINYRGLVADGPELALPMPGVVLMYGVVAPIAGFWQNFVSGDISPLGITLPADREGGWLHIWADTFVGGVITTLPAVVGDGFGIQPALWDVGLQEVAKPDPVRPGHDHRIQYDDDAPQNMWLGHDFDGDGVYDEAYDYTYGVAPDHIGAAFQIIVVNPACPADFNGDGFIDFFDIDEYVAAFESGC